MEKRIDYITVLSVISALSVVGLHTNGVFWQFSTKHYWLTANILECLFYYAVPIFFMITGITLIDFNKRYSLKEYFLKRLHRVVIPFIFWSLMGMVYDLCRFPEHLDKVNIWYIINGITSTSFIGIFWFFIPLFGIYMSIPLFSAVPEKHRIPIFKYLIGISFVVIYLIPLLIKAFGLPIKYGLSVPVGSSCLIYVLLGYVLSRTELTKKQKLLIYAVTAIGFLVHWGGTYFLSMHAGHIVRTFKGYQNVPCILYSTGVFILLKDLSPGIMSFPWLKKLINFLSKYTFAIYLIQFFFLRLFVDILHVNKYSMTYRLGGIILITGLAVCVTWIIRKIPLGKYLLP